MRSAAIVLSIAGAAAAGESALESVQNAVCEWSLRSEKAYADPWSEVALDALVTTPAGEERRVPAFWAGGGLFKVRYAAGEVGLHRFRTECSDPSNRSLHGVEGSIEVKPYRGEEVLLRHGPIRVAAGRNHFQHIDGTPFFWLADTWWMGFTRRLTWPDDFQALTADRVKKGFNVVQIVAGLYPDMPAFDPRGANEAGFPWTEDYSRINPAYFDAADRRIEWLVRSGIVPCIVGAWGYHLPWLGVERMKMHWRYLVARYGAYPVVWCVAGEGIMPYYLSQKKEEDRTFQRKGWTEVARYLRKIDPYRRAVSIHPTDAARKQVEDPAVLDFDMLQTGHGDRDSIPNTLNLVRASRAASPPMPTINAEVCYEGILGTCHQEVQRFMVWSCLLSGTAGHTYGANGIWQVNRRGEPFGKSPHGGNWGETPWDDAMRLPGSAQAGLARKLLERYPWPRFEPHPEWASLERVEPRVNWGEWIWFPEGDPRRDAPTEPRFFRRTFDLPAGQVTRAILRLSVDDRFTAYLNGKRLGSHQAWKPHREFNVTAALKPGKNVLSVQAENLKQVVPQNPAGLLCSFEIQEAGGDRMEILSDAHWRCSDREEPGWTEVDFDARGWKSARPIARYGEGPWGTWSASDQFMVPYASGIPGKVRVFYFPALHPVTLHGLEREVKYHARHFYPASGEEREVGPVEGDEKGSSRVPPPAGGSEDWVLVLEAR